MDLSQAISAHVEWKVKLRAAIMKKEQLDANSVSIDNKCALGQWLYGEAKIKYGQLKSYPDLLAKHAVFHKEVARVALLVNSQKYAEAETMLGVDSSYSNASNDVRVAIQALKKEAGL